MTLVVSVSAILSQWPPDPIQLPESHRNRLMGLPAGECAEVWLAAVVYYSSGSPGMQLMANIKAVLGILEQQECGWRSSPMNSPSYMGQTPSAHCIQAHYQFIQPLNTPFLFKFFLFPFSLKGALFLSFFSFLSMNFDNSNFRSMTSYESHAGKRSHVFEASRPLHLFDQQLGCEFCRSESGSEAPWGPPFMPATSRG